MNFLSICYFDCNPVTSDPNKFCPAQMSRLLSLSHFESFSKAGKLGRGPVNCTEQESSASHPRPFWRGFRFFGGMMIPRLFFVSASVAVGLLAAPPLTTIQDVLYK